MLTGLETWFTLPGKAAIVPPPRYKMAVVTWLAVFPLITGISLLLQHQLVLLPLVLRVMVVTAIAVPTMTYFLMPQMTRLFAAWLYPVPSHRSTDLPDETRPLALEPVAAQPFDQALALDQALPVEVPIASSQTDSFHPFEANRATVEQVI